MTTALVLFNDYYHPREGGVTWTVRTHAGNDGNQQSITATWHDGNLATVEAFSDPNVGAELVDLFQGGGILQGIKAFGLVRNTFGGMVMNVAGSGARVISGGNYIYSNILQNQYYDVEIYAANNDDSGFVAALFAGQQHLIEVDYPAGWRPPFMQQASDSIRLQRDVYPLSRRAKPKPIDVTIPITLQTQAAARSVLHDIIDRMQGEPFMYQWDINDNDHTMFCWLRSHSGFKLTAGGLVGIDLQLRGYIDYGDAM